MEYTPIISKNSKYWIKSKTPKTKQQQLDVYVMNNDILTRDYLLSIGITRFNKSIEGIERRCKVEVVPIDNNSWRITK